MLLVIFTSIGAAYVSRINYGLHLVVWLKNTIHN